MFKIALALALIPPLLAGNTQVLWRNPGHIPSKNLAIGPGGPAEVPKPPFHFVSEDLGGSSPKIKVRDARGHEWSVKFGEEVHSDPFASRLAWAVGYSAEPSHFVRAGTILETHHLTRAKHLVAPNGSFRNARFQYRSQAAKFSKSYNWSWVNNPFLGTRELNGLKILIMLTSNWDAKDARDIDRDANTAVFEERVGRATRYVYFLPDWGGSMGRWGGVAQRSKWDCRGYARQNEEFVQGIKKGFVEWGYSGQHTADITKDIRLADVKWLLRYLGQITDEQIHAALVACGATPAEAECYGDAIRDRIDRLQDLTRNPGRWTRR